MEKSPIVEIAKKVCPAVVTIVVSKDLPKVESFFLFPYGEEQILLPQVDKNQKEKTQIGDGSGFLVSEDGLLNPKESYPAKILARDPLIDIAILKIEGKNFPYIELGDSDQIELGETVVAIGNALGEFEDTLSAGIVSGLSRKITAYGGLPFKSTSLRGLIQTDAAINPGNSGGPLVNIEGKAIGVNTAMVLGAQNIGFAIPINYAKSTLEEVKKFGKIKRPFLGIRYIILNKQISQVQKIPVDYGALIIRETFGEPAIIPNSSADKAGLKEYDIILEVDGQKITEDNTLSDILSTKNVGDEITLKILRDGKEIGEKLKLEERE
jgi:serine protease Do